MLKAVVIAAVVAAGSLGPSVGHAQSTPEKKELVAKVLQLQQPGLEATGRALAEQPAVQLMQQAGMVLQRVPQERRDALARDIEADVRKYADEAGPLLSAGAVRLAPSTVGVLLEERFTEDELRQIITILESPVNRKFQSMGGDMQKALAEKLVPELRAQIEPMVRTMQASVQERLGPPAGAASAPASPARPAAAASRPAAATKKP